MSIKIGIVRRIEGELRPATWNRSGGTLPTRTAMSSCHLKRVNDDSGTLNQATKGAPVVRRQIEQWHTLSWHGVPVVSGSELPRNNSASFQHHDLRCGLRSMGKSLRRPAGLDRTQQLEAEMLVERHVPRVARFEVGETAVAIALGQRMPHQDAAQPPALMHRVDADQRQVPVRLPR